MFVEEIDFDARVHPVNLVEHMHDLAPVERIPAVGLEEVSDKPGELAVQSLVAFLKVHLGREQRQEVERNSQQEQDKQENDGDFPV